MTVKRLFWLVVLGAACSSAPERDEPDEPENVAMLSPAQHLVRVSMALRGTRPSPEELREVRDNPEAVERFVDQYLLDQGFGEMIRDLYNEALTVRVGAPIYPAGFPAVGNLSGVDVQLINVSVTEAPLRLIEHVVMNNRPYREIVTADYTVADSMVAEVWGLPYDGTGRSWEVTHYQDGRPHAGILSDSWIWTRHSTTFSNQNRGRANTVSRALLCNDYIERQLEVDTSINLADPQEVANAVSRNSACASCHQTLDPLASYLSSFYPIYVASEITTYPFDLWAPELSNVFSTREPGYFGYTGGDVRYLGQMIAEDPRFTLCAARRAYAYFHQVPLADVPQGRAAELQAVLMENGSIKELARAIVLADEFRISHALTDGPEADEKALLKARPWQIARAIEELSGFRWEAQLDIDIGTGNVGLVDMMTDSFFGYEVLAGGIDSQNVTIPAHTMTATTSLVLSGLASQAVETVVTADFDFPGSAKLLTLVAPGDRDEAKVREQLVDLHLRLFGQFVEPSSEEVSLSYALFRGALDHAGGDVERAWKTTLYGMLQNIRMVYY